MEPDVVQIQLAEEKERRLVAGARSEGRAGQALAVVDDRQEFGDQIRARRAVRERILPLERPLEQSLELKEQRGAAQLVARQRFGVRRSERRGQCSSRLIPRVVEEVLRVGQRRPRKRKIQVGSGLDWTGWWACGLVTALTHRAATTAQHRPSAPVRRNRSGRPAPFKDRLALDFDIRDLGTAGSLGSLRSDGQSIDDPAHAFYVLRVVSRFRTTGATRVGALQGVDNSSRPASPTVDGFVSTPPRDHPARPGSANDPAGLAVVREDVVTYGRARLSAGAASAWSPRGGRVGNRAGGCGGSRLRRDVGNRIPRHRGSAAPRPR